jgi:DNA primase
MGRAPDIENRADLMSDVDLVRLIEESGVVLTRAGDTAKGRCPWHADDDPSLLVTISRQLWRCFPCRIGGSCFDWVMKRDGVSFKHAKEILAARIAGQPPGARTGAPQACVPGLDGRRRPPAPQGGWWTTTHRRSSASRGPRDYLRRRGLDDAKLIETFKLGYANRTLAYRLPPKSRERATTTCAGG